MKKFAHILLSLLLLFQQSSAVMFGYKAFVTYLGTAMVSYVYASAVDDARSRAKSLFLNTREGANTGKAVDSEGTEIDFSSETDFKTLTGMGKEGSEITRSNTGNFNGDISNPEELVNADYEKAVELNENADSLEYNNGSNSHQNNSNFGASRAFRVLQFNEANKGDRPAAVQALIDRLSGKAALSDGTNLNDLVEANSPAIVCEEKKEFETVNGNGTVEEVQACTKLNTTKLVKTGCQVTRQVHRDSNGALQEEFKDYPTGCYLGNVSPVEVDVTQGDGTIGKFTAKAGYGNSTTKEIEEGSIDASTIQCTVSAPSIEIDNQKSGQVETISASSHGKFLSPMFPGDNPQATICTTAYIDNFYADLSNAPACNFFPEYSECNPERLGLADYNVDPRQLTWAQFAEAMPTDCSDTRLKNPECREDSNISCQYETTHFTENLDSACEFKGQECVTEDIFQKYTNLKCQKTKFVYSCSMPDPWTDKRVKTTTICKPKDAVDNATVATYQEQDRVCKTFNPVKAIKSGCTVEYKPKGNQILTPVGLLYTPNSLPVSSYTKHASNNERESSLVLETTNPTDSLTPVNNNEFMVDIKNPSELESIKIQLQGFNALNSDLPPGALQSLADFNVSSIEVNGVPIRGLEEDVGASNPLVLKEHRITTDTVRYEGGPYPLTAPWITIPFNNGGEIVNILPGVITPEGGIDRSQYSNWKTISDSTVPEGYFFHLKPSCQWSYPAHSARNTIAQYTMSSDGNPENGLLPKNHTNNNYPTPIVYNARSRSDSYDLKYRGGCFASAYLKKYEPQYKTVLQAENRAVTIKVSNDSKFSLEGRVLKFEHRKLDARIEFDFNQNSHTKGLFKSGENRIKINFSSTPTRINKASIKTQRKEGFVHYRLVETPANCLTNPASAQVDESLSSLLKIDEGSYTGIIFDKKEGSFQTGFNAVLQNSRCVSAKPKNQSVENTTYGEAFGEKGAIATKNVSDDEVCLKAEVDNYYLDASNNSACDFITCNDDQFEFYSKDGVGFNAEGLSWAGLANNMPMQCDKYSQNELCSYKGKQCAPSPFNEGEHCSVTDKSYSCLIQEGSTDIKTNQAAISHCVPETVNQPDGTKKIVYNCPEGEAVETDIQSFSRIATKLSIPQHMQTDSSCLDPDSPDKCSMFTGKYYQCNSMQAWGFGGDCCRHSVSVTYLDYIEGAYTLSEIKYVREGVNAAYGLAEQSVMNTEFGQAVSGAYDSASGFAKAGWEYLSDNATAAYDAIKKPFVDIGNSIRDLFTTSTQEAATQAGASATAEVGTQVSGAVIDQGLIGTMQNKVYTAMYDGLNYLADGLGDQIFQQVTTEAGQAVTDSAGSAVMQVNPAISTAFSYLMWVYYAYVIINLIINIISQCDKNELEFQQKGSMKLCTQVRNQWCSDKTWFGCREKSKGYCCYQSILSRIINEQGAPQLGMSLYGNRCAGFTLEQMEKLNWGQLDLTEWTNSLMKSSLLKPSTSGLDSKLTMDSMTGKTAKAMGADTNLVTKVNQRYIATEETLAAVEEDMRSGDVMRVKSDGDTFTISKGVAPYQDAIDSEQEAPEYATNEFEGGYETCNINRTGQNKQSYLKVRVNDGLFLHRLVLYPSCGGSSGFANSGGNCNSPEVDTGWTYGNTPGVIIRPDGTFSYEPTPDKEGNTSACSGQFLDRGDDYLAPTADESLIHSNEGVVKSCDFGLKAKIEKSRLWIDLLGDGNWQYADGGYPNLEAQPITSCWSGSTLSGSIKRKENFKFTSLGYQKFQVDKWDSFFHQNTTTSLFDDDEICSVERTEGVKKSCTIDLSNTSDEYVANEQGYYQNRQVVGTCDLNVSGVRFSFEHSGYISGARSVSLTATKTGTILQLDRTVFDGVKRVSYEGDLTISNAQALGIQPIVKVQVIAKDQSLLTRVNYGSQTQVCSTILN